MSKAKIGQITDSCLGKMLDAAKNKGEYAPYLANANVRWGGFDLSDLPLMRFEEDEQDRYGLQYGDLVMCEGGEPGRCAIWRNQIPNMKIQKALHRIRPRDGVDVRWLYYWFLLHGQKHLLDRYFIKTTIMHLPGDRLREIEIDVPDYSTQCGIGDVLSAIDAKIEVNTHISVALESMAKMIYIYWFTQFDFPNVEGKPYRSSGGKMVWNEQLKREIPKGWEVGTIDSILAIDNNSVDPSKLGDTIMEHYSIPAFDDGKYPVFEPANTIESGKYIVNRECILTSKLNPHFKRLWDPYCDTDNAICSTEFIVYRPRDLWTRSYCFAVLNSDSFYAHMVSNATASTGSRKRIQPDVSASFQLAIPDEQTIRAFVKVYDPILKQLKNLRKENHELANLRDWLLPMLMNGQATVE